MVRYQLSNRQRKELDNGKLLSIALPHPQDDVTDYVAWVRKHLELPATALITAEAINVPVNPLIRSGGLAAVFGAILHLEGQDKGRAELVLNVDCIVAEIALKRSVRGVYPHQWPGKAILSDGRVLPAENAS
jgi:hypothetical protein